MKKLIPLILSLTLLSCSSNIKYVSGNFKDLGKINIQNMGEVNNLEFYSIKDSSLYIIPFKGSKNDLKFLRKITKNKTLSYDPFSDYPPYDLEGIKDILGL